MENKNHIEAFFKKLEVRIIQISYKMLVFKKISFKINYVK